MSCHRWQLSHRGDRASPITTFSSEPHRLTRLPAPNHNMFISGENRNGLSVFTLLGFPLPRCGESWSVASNCYLFFLQLDATPYGSQQLKRETVKMNAVPPSHASPNPLSSLSLQRRAFFRNECWDCTDHRPNPLQQAFSIFNRTSIRI